MVHIKIHLYSDEGVVGRSETGAMMETIGKIIIK